MSTTQTTSYPHSSIGKLASVATWPPLVYFVLGSFMFLLWLAGTAVQVQTSEAWIMHASVSMFPTLSTFGQVWDFITGHLEASQVVPFIFAWGVQIALIIASVGVEMPRYPKWRYHLSWGIIIALIGVNSAGDYVYSSSYGFWGQTGFTLVILFVTFSTGLLAVICFTHGLKKMFPPEA